MMGILFGGLTVLWLIQMWASRSECDDYNRVP